MVSAGVDVGVKSVKVLILDGGRVIGRASVLSGFNQESALKEALRGALKEASLRRETIQRVVATGMGREVVGDADERITEVTADAKGAFHLVPSARTVISVGVEEARTIRLDERGCVVDFAVNERCAAGAGAFIEAMARALEVTVDGMAELALKSKKSLPLNAQCAVFAESEVVTLIHSRTPKADIARAIFDAIASRIGSLARRVGIADDVVLIGGLAYNKGFLNSLEEATEHNIKVPDCPEYVGALGAALSATGG